MFVHLICRIGPLLSLLVLLIRNSGLKHLCEDIDAPEADRCAPYLSGRKTRPVNALLFAALTLVVCATMIGLNDAVLRKCETTRVNAIRLIGYVRRTVGYRTSPKKQSIDT